MQSSAFLIFFMKWSETMPSMSEAAKEARRAYQRKWRMKNPEKVRAAQDRYWTKKAQENNIRLEMNRV